MAERVLGGVSVRGCDFLLCSFSCVVYRQPQSAHCLGAHDVCLVQVRGCSVFTTHLPWLLQRARELMTREERELQDVDRQMEEQLIQEHMQACAAHRLLWSCWSCAVGSLSSMCTFSKHLKPCFGCGGAPHLCSMVLNKGHDRQCSYGLKG